MSCTRKYTKVLEESQHLLLKCLAVPQRSFLVFISDLGILNLLLNFIAEPTYYSKHFIHVIK